MQDSQETGGKGNILMTEREIDNMLLGEAPAGQNGTGTKEMGGDGREGHQSEGTMSAR